MTKSSAALVIFFTVIFVTGVTTWTIDLPEVRKIYFEKFSTDDEQPRSQLNGEERFYDNIESNSPHNTQHHYYDIVKQYEEKHSDVYANTYNNYESYMVKKVQDTLQNGTEYLEGLRKSIERYIEVLENCSRINFTLEIPPNMTLPLSIGIFSGVRDYRTMCARASAASEHVRRLSQLALWTTNKLQDVAYKAKYNKDDSMEENELLLRLAWYLDKLAHLTGYDPHPHEFVTPKTEKPPVATSTLPPNISEETKASILSCLRKNSSVPATERCALPAPPLAQQIANLFTSRMQTSGRVSRRSNDDTSDTALEPELLLATDNKGILPPILTAKKSVQKRSVSDENHPMVKVLKYYAKHKAWVNSNPHKNIDSDNLYEKHEQFDVKNDLHVKSVQKRSLGELLKNKFKFPEHPFYDVDVYALHSPGVYLHPEKPIANIIKETIEKFHKAKAASEVKLEMLKKLLRPKRSTYPHTHYGTVVKPRVSVDPQKDLSYYVKNKSGTEYRENLVQAALVRAALEAVFQRGNIEVVHRYGSNFNPADPAPFYSGVVRTISDI